MAELLCFGPAGGGTADFRAWPELLAPHSVRPIRLPGRETLRSTPAFQTIEALVDWLLAELDPSEPFALYGHSMGAWVAFELAHALQARGHQTPTHLFVAARRAPHLPGTLPPLAHLSEAEFVRQVQERYGAIPERLLATPSILRLFLPTLRADFALLDAYRCADRPPLDLPITAFRGLGDATVSRSELAAWRTLTTGAFALRQVPGGHFFHRDDPELLCDALAGSLR